MKGAFKLRARKALVIALVMSQAIGFDRLTAQTVPDEQMSAPSSALNLPKDMTIFGTADPNVRKATAIVNGSVITETDIQQRLALVVLANGGKVSDEERARLRLQVLRNLIDETLQIQEAAAKDIKISPAELDQNFARVAANFKKTPEDFANYLKSQGSSAASIKRQIEGETAWSRLLRSRVQPFVNVSEDEVRGVMDRLKQSKGKDEYRISEIYLSSSPENRAQVEANGKQILDQIRKGGSFAAYARQYSEASTAAVGGDLGWIRAAQLPSELGGALTGMQIGQVAGPIPLAAGFSIIYLVDKRQVLTADPRDALLSLTQVGITFPPGTTQAQAQARAKSFEEKTRAIQGCGAVRGVASEIGADVVENDGIRVRDLPPQLQKLLLDLQVGQATPPFGSVSEGVRVLFLCGRDDPQESSGPTFDQLMSQMEEDRVNKRARTYLRDLRRDAVIDYN